MLANFFGIVCLVVGGIIACGILIALIGTVVGLLWMALKLAVPALLIYWGYRLVTRNRRVVY